MIESYPAKIKYISEDKSYLVEFPDLPGMSYRKGYARRG